MYLVNHSISSLNWITLNTITVPHNLYFKMKWFGGSIPEAISVAKSNQGIFVVYIYDKSDQSKTVTESLDNDEVSSAMSSSKFTCIKLENGSTEAGQFSHIYPLIVVPSLFFISGETGVPIEVLGGAVTPKTVIEKLVNINSYLDKELTGQASSSSSKKEVDIKKDTVTVDTCAEGSSKEKPNDEKSEPPPPSSNLSTDTAEIATRPATVNETIEPLERRVDLAQNLVSQLQEQKSLEQMEKDKQSEIERRRTGYEVARAKQKREENERMEMAKLRRKNKQEELIAREQVKAQIAADRADRQARENSMRGAQNEAPPAVAPPSASPKNHRHESAFARIKFRFPSSTDASQFPSTATLADVRKYLDSSPSLPFASYELLTLMPKRILTHQLNSKNLQELQLCPSSIIIVKPVRNSSAVVPSGITSLFWSLITPFTFILSYLGRILGLGNRRNPSSSELSDEELESPPSKQPRTEGSFTTRNRPSSSYGVRRGKGAGGSRRDGNIHRLNSGNSDDDENNTWNGNSTEQM